MDIKNILNELIHYFNVTRGVGHTKTVLDGVRNIDDCLMVVDTHWFSDIAKLENPPSKSKLISFSYICDRLRGYHRPLVFDNLVLWLIFNNSLKKIEDLELEIRTLKSKIEDAQKALK